MEVKLNIGYRQLIDIISQLPPEDMSKLRKEVERLLDDSNVADQDDWESLILNGPVMSEQQYQEFEKNRKHFNQWRKS